jgi:thiamine-phosphate pyrophosphorylase
MTRRFDLSVYLITDPVLTGARSVTEVVEMAIAGGATMVQYRNPDDKTRILVDEARAILALTKPAKVPFIVNDRIDVALAIGADGVHVGQADMRVADVRRLIGPAPIVGLSITSEADLDVSDFGGVDYLGVGPVFATSTKPDAAPPINVGGLEAIVARTKIPIVAIGGLHAGNAADAIAAGAAGVAVVSAICAAPDPTAATKELVGIVKGARKSRQ